MYFTRIPNQSKIHFGIHIRYIKIHVGKFAFGDRTIPIHARTLGPHLENPNEMGVYYGTVQSAVLHTN